MATPRRVGTETSETRARLLDVTEQIMLDDGYAAVSSRRVAKDAGVTAALVHYYFGTIDDLFLAVLRRRVEQQLGRLRRVVSSSEQPLRALWEVATDTTRTGLVLEFMGLANHRKVIRSELAASSEQFRKLQLELVQPHVDRWETVPDEVGPLELLVLINAIGQNMVLERSIGMDLGHAATAALVERFLERIEPNPTEARRARTSPTRTAGR